MGTSQSSVSKGAEYIQNSDLTMRNEEFGLQIAQEKKKIEKERENDRKEQQQLERRREEAVERNLIRELALANPCKTFLVSNYYPDEQEDADIYKKVCNDLAQKDGRFFAEWRKRKFDDDEDDVEIKVCFYN